MDTDNTALISAICDMQKLARKTAEEVAWYCTSKVGLKTEMLEALEELQLLSYGRSLAVRLVRGVE